MTIGDVLIPGGYPTKNFRFRKTWNGGDGKYETTGEYKWNPYSMGLSQESDQLGSTACLPVSTLSHTPVAWPTYREMNLQSKLVKHIKGHEFNLAVNLAQANKVVQMCASTIGHMCRALYALKGGHVAVALRELGVTGSTRPLHSSDVSGRWLEMQYGWLPTVKDCFEAAKAFEELSMGRSARVSAVQKHEVPIDGSASPSLYTCPGWSKSSKRIVCELSEELSFGRSLGLTDPLSVAWEIIPYSFVFDWFLPVGTYLENLNVIPKLKGRFLTIYIRKETTAYSRGFNPDYSGARRVGRTVLMTRTPSTSLTTQRPAFVKPLEALTVKRIANAVALAHSSLTRKVYDLRFIPDMNLF